MASITITVFSEDTLFGDDTKFGYTQTKDTFPTDAINDVDSILQETGTVYQITEQTTTEDSMGNVTAVSDDTFYVYGRLEALTQKDRQLIDMGVAIVGYIKGFFLESYNTKYIREGLVLTDLNGVDWRIVQVNERNINGDVVFVSCLLRNIYLDGSE